MGGSSQVSSDTLEPRFHRTAGIRKDEEIEPVEEKESEAAGEEDDRNAEESEQKEEGEVDPEQEDYIVRSNVRCGLIRCASNLFRHRTFLLPLYLHVPLNPAPNLRELGRKRCVNEVVAAAEALLVCWFVVFRRGS